MNATTDLLKAAGKVGIFVVICLLIAGLFGMATASAADSEITIVSDNQLQEAQLSVGNIIKMPLTEAGPDLYGAKVKVFNRTGGETKQIATGYWAVHAGECPNPSHIDVFGDDAEFHATVPPVAKWVAEAAAALCDALPSNTKVKNPRDV